MGSLKAHDDRERALALARQMAAEETARATAEKAGIDAKIKAVTLGGGVSLPGALELLDKYPPEKLENLRRANFVGR